LNSRRRLFTILFSAIGMLVLILDSKTALQGAMEGIELCIRTAIPSLFPFFVLSILLTGQLTGNAIPLLRPIARVCGIPSGGEAILAVGLLGGYPVGASCVAMAYRKGQLSANDAHRLLGFCSNAGPAFLFGIVSHLFSSMRVVWALWAIHILSALCVGALLPCKTTSRAKTMEYTGTSLPKALDQSVRVMASVCGWIVLFRVLIHIFSRWFLWLLPEPWDVSLTGLFELVNGCHALTAMESVFLRFVLCSAFLAFGGLCVTMQTASVTEGLGLGMYLPGKILQTIISILMAFPVGRILFSEERIRPNQWITLIGCTLAALFIVFFVFKKTVAFPQPLIYNKQKSR